MKTQKLKSLRSAMVLSAVATAVLASGCTTVQQVIPGSSEPSVGQAVSERKSDRVGRHFYAATGVGASRLNPDASEVPAFTVNDRVEAGGQVTLGMDLSRQWSLELHSAEVFGTSFRRSGKRWF